VHEEFGALLLDAGRAADALREFDVVLALEPHDMATAWYNVARAQHALGDFAASQASVLQALDVAPGFRPAQKLLLQLARHNAD
jgi:tetratricopeptide (TPR) repeat protein